MAVLKRSHQKTITSSVFAGVIIATLIFAVMIISRGTSLSNGAGTAEGILGPLHLFELYKNALPEGGYSAGIRVSFGAIGVLLSIGAAAGLVIGYISTKAKKPARQTL